MSSELHSDAGTHLQKVFSSTQHCQVARKHRVHHSIKHASGCFFPKASFRNPFRERRYAIDLKLLSRGSNPPTTTTTASTSRASHSVMRTEALSEQGHCLHLPLPAVWAQGSWERGCWLRRIHHRVGGIEKGGSRWGEKRGRWEMWRSVLQDILITVLTFGMCAHVCQCDGAIVLSDMCWSVWTYGSEKYCFPLAPIWNRTSIWPPVLLPP